MSLAGTWIYVTRDDIDNGKRLDPQRCMIALATAKRFNLSIDDNVVGVAYEHVRITLDDDYYYHLSKRTQEQIRMWDRRVPIKPFRFKLLSEGNR